MKKIVHPKERRYYAICLAISAVMYASVLAVTISQPHVGLTFLAYASVFWLVSFFGMGIFTGWVKGNALRLSAEQFPEVYTLAENLSKQVGLKSLPPVYLLDGSGVLNAFAAKFLGRYYVLIYSEVFELAYEKGEAELAFVLAHELAHIKRRHLSLRWLTVPAHFVPFLGNALSRAQELSSDRIAAHVVPQGAVSGLLCLAAGKTLYRRASIEGYLQQTQNEKGFWVWLSEKVSSHPHLPKRISEVRSYLRVLATPATIEHSMQMPLWQSNGSQDWAMR